MYLLNTNKAMKNIGIILILCCIMHTCTGGIYAQTRVNLPQNKNIIANFVLNEDDTTRYVNHYLFEQAYQVIEAMLTGKQEKSFREALFWVECAYLQGTLDKTAFDKQIDDLTRELKVMASYDKKAPTKDMALNYAIFTLFYRPCPLNNNTPYTYDIRAIIAERDRYQYGLVTHLLEEGKGSCRSLPYLYKILADEIGAEAYLVAAPMHFFIRHRDHNGKWWNLETTTGSFRSSGSIIDEMHVPEAGIRSGLYMNNYDINAELVLCLYDLASIYEDLTGVYSNFFIRKCYTLGLQYSSPHIIESRKVEDMRYQLNKTAWNMGLRKEEELINNPVLSIRHKELEDEEKKIKDIGYYEFSPEEYRIQLERLVNYVNTPK